MNQNDRFIILVWAAHIGATIAAGVVAFGATLGFHDMTGDWPIAILCGVGIASLLAIGWYTLIKVGAYARRPGVKTTAIVLGIALFAFAVGTSGWALATAIGGKQALSNYQYTALAEHETQLTLAKNNVDAQRNFVDTVLQYATATGMLGREEARTGEGPYFRSYQRTEENLRNAAAGMSAKLNAGNVIYEEGMSHIEAANLALGHADRFRQATSNIQTTIMDLNNIDVSQDILNIGMVGLNDRGLPELEELTAQLRKEGEKARVQPVRVPRYIPITRSEATLKEPPIGAWIAAIAIDIAPLLMLLIVMISINEPLLREREPKKPPRRKSDEQIRDEEKNVIGINRIAGE